MNRLLHFISSATLICMAVLSTSCKTTKVSKKNIVTHDTTIVHVVKLDTIIVQKTDTVVKQGIDIIKHADISYERMLDSMQTIQALQDKRIKSLLSQIYNNDLHIEPIQTSTGSAHATAGVDNNKLWLKLNIDSIGIVTQSTTDKTTINNTIVDEKQTKTTDHVGYSMICLLLLILICLLLIALIVRKYLDK